MSPARKPCERCYVVVMGPLASGKSTLAKLLADYLGWEAELENLSTHPYLTEYYSDQERWAFHTVVEFIARGFASQRRVRQLLRQTSVCQDWYVAEHVDIYGRLVLAQGTIDAREFATFWSLHEALMDGAVRPDVLVQLTTDPKTILARVAARGRSGETSGLTLAYVEDLLRIYSEWTAGLGVPVVRVNSTETDFRDPTSLGAVAEQILRLLPSRGARSG